MHSNSLFEGTPSIRVRCVPPAQFWDPCFFSIFVKRNRIGRRPFLFVLSVTAGVLASLPCWRQNLSHPAVGMLMYQSSPRTFLDATQNILPVLLHNARSQSDNLPGAGKCNWEQVGLAAAHRCSEVRNIGEIALILLLAQLKMSEDLLKLDTKLLV